MIDLDPQEGNLTSLFDVREHRDDPDADNLVRHILEMPEGPFEDLIETSEKGVDVIPSHDMLGDFTLNLEQKIAYETGMKNMDEDEFPRYELLYELLWSEQQLHEQYDAVLIDPNARAEDLLFNAIYAMRTLVAPVKPAGKGNLSLDGLEHAKFDQPAADRGATEGRPDDSEGDRRPGSVVDQVLVTRHRRHTPFPLYIR